MAKMEQAPAVSIVLIETTGALKTLKTKELTPETLYKKCGFRVNEDFLARNTWQVKLKGSTETYTIALWGKKTGKANFENKYDLPPPLDKELFFGTCAVVRLASDGTFLDLTKETWLKIYEHLFGGFEDIGDEDEYSEDELADVDPSLLTVHGYLKDDFVVSDKDTIPSGEVSADEEVIAAPIKKKKTTTKAEKSSAPKKSKAKKTVAEKKEEPEEITDNSSELESEVYTFSDDD